LREDKNFSTQAILLKGRLKGRSPFKNYTSPSPLDEEKGIKGRGSIKEERY